MSICNPGRVLFRQTLARRQPHPRGKRHAKSHWANTADVRLPALRAIARDFATPSGRAAHVAVPPARSCQNSELTRLRLADASRRLLRAIPFEQLRRRVRARRSLLQRSPLLPDFPFVYFEGSLYIRRRISF